MLYWYFLVKIVLSFSVTLWVRLEISDAPQASTWCWWRSWCEPINILTEYSSRVDEKVAEVEFLVVTWHWIAQTYFNIKTNCSNESLIRSVNHSFNQSYAPCTQCYLPTWVLKKRVRHNFVVRNCKVMPSMCLWKRRDCYFLRLKIPFTLLHEFQPFFSV